MRKNVFGRKFKRTVDQRRQLFKGLLSSLVLNEKMQTTEAKAKAIKGQFDKLVTKAKKQGAKSKPQIAAYLTPPAMEKLITDIAPRNAKRQGGYTRIIRLGRRMTDSAAMVVIELVERKVSEVSKVPQVSKGERKEKVVKVEPVRQSQGKKVEAKKPKTRSKKA